MIILSYVRRLSLIILIMKPVIDTEFGAPEAPIAQTKKPGALQEGINKKLLLALAAIGFTATHIEQAN